MKRTITLVLLSLALSAAPAAAQVAILHSFAGGPNDGQNPEGTLTHSGSTFYGMTPNGGASGDGTVFKIGAAGNGFGLLHSFAGGLNDGDIPNGSLIQFGSTLYGMTQFGGSTVQSGTVFKINAAGSGFGLIHSFVGSLADGGLPLGTLAQSGPTQYGMTSQGGGGNLGTVFRVNADGTGFSLLHSFSSSPTDGNTPSFSSLVVSGSTLYGMTGGGGTADLARCLR